MRFETEALRDTCFYGIGVNHGGMGDASPKKNLRWGVAILPPPPQYGWLTGQPTRLEHAFF